MTVEKYVADLVEEYPYLEGAEILEVIMPVIEMLVSIKIQSFEATEILEANQSGGSTRMEIARAAERVTILASTAIELGHGIEKMIEAIERHFVD